MTNQIGKIGIGKNVFLKNSNLEKHLKHSNVLLENIFAGLYKEFRRNWYPLSFNITAVLSKATLESVGLKHNFPFSYYIHSIAVLNQTNSLAGVSLEINDQLYPSEGFTVATTASTPSKDMVYRGNASIASVYPFKKYIDKPFNLQLHYINTHTSNQIIYLSILGYRVDVKEILRVIKKTGAVRYE